MTIAEKILRAKNDYDSVYEAGKKSEYDKFWDSYQINGTLTSYKYKFAYSGWTDVCFNPKYPLVCTNDGGDYIFVFNTAITDTKVPITFGTSANQTFNWCSALKRAHIIVNKDTKFSDTFYKCGVLETLIVEGTIGKNGFDVSACPLTYESLESIANALEEKDPSAPTGTWVIKLGSNYATLGNELIQTIESKGWSIQ